MDIPILLLGRPALERGRVAHQRREVAVVQPVQHGVFLQHAGELGAPGARRAFFRAELRVPLDEPCADHQDIADFDIAALRLWAQVDALLFRAGLQFREADAVRCVGVVADVVRVGIVAVVEEDGPAGDPVRRPVVDTAAEVGVGAVDVGGFGLYTLVSIQFILDGQKGGGTYVVVKASGGDMSKLSRVTISTVPAGRQAWSNIHGGIHPTACHFACSMHRYHRRQLRGRVP